jgi:hypothetical protein
MASKSGQLRELRVISVSSDTTIDDNAHHGCMLNVTATSAIITITFPAAATMPNGFTVIINRDSSSSKDITLSGGVTNTLNNIDYRASYSTDSTSWFLVSGTPSQISMSALTIKGNNTTAASSPANLTVDLVANLLSGSSSATLCIGNDTRLSNVGTPVGTTLTSGNIWVGNASSAAASVSMSGDATLSNAGALTIANSAVTNAKMAGMATKTLKGNISSATAAPTDITQANLLLYFLQGIPNNVNTLTQLDQYGNGQNIVYLDNDNDMVIGGLSDVRATILTAWPINIFRQHVHIRFNMLNYIATGDERLQDVSVGTGGGGSFVLGSGKMTVRTGAASTGDGKELKGTNIVFSPIAGQRLFFYHEMPAANNFVCEFGCKDSSTGTHYAKFTRTDAASEANIIANVADGGAATTYDTGIKVGTNRILYCINFVSSTTIEFYISDTGGQLILRATFTNADHVPTGSMVPFFRLYSSGATVNKEAILSQFYFVLIE